MSTFNIAPCQVHGAGATFAGSNGPVRTITAMTYFGPSQTAVLASAEALQAFLASGLDSSPVVAVRFGEDGLPIEDGHLLKLLKSPIAARLQSLRLGSSDTGAWCRLLPPSTDPPVAPCNALPACASCTVRVMFVPCRSTAACCVPRCAAGNGLYVTDAGVLAIVDKSPAAARAGAVLLHQGHRPCVRRHLRAHAAPDGPAPDRQRQEPG